MVGFGESEAPHPLACGQFGQVFSALLLGTVSVDRVHHEAGLHAHHRAVSGINPLHLAGNQAIRHMVRSNTAVLLRNRRAKKAQLAQFVEDFVVKGLRAGGLQDAGHQLGLAVVVRGFADELFFFGELLGEQHGVGPIEGGVGSHFSLSGLAFITL